MPSTFLLSLIEYIIISLLSLQFCIYLYTGINSEYFDNNNCNLSISFFLFNDWNGYYFGGNDSLCVWNYALQLRVTSRRNNLLWSRGWQWRKGFLSWCLRWVLSLVPLQNNASFEIQGLVHTMQNEISNSTSHVVTCPFVAPTLSCCVLKVPRSIHATEQDMFLFFFART